MYNFSAQLSEVANLAIGAIYGYDGEDVVTLPTGERAIDNDDAWIIIGGDDDVIVRDKREQRVREAYAKEGKEYDESESSDYYMDDKWSYEEICEFADNLLGQ